MTKTSKAQRLHGNLCDFKFILFLFFGSYNYHNSTIRGFELIYHTQGNCNLLLKFRFISANFSS